MAHDHQTKFREIRAYDGGSTGDSQNVAADSNYIVGVKFGEMDVPLGRGTPEDILSLDQGQFNQNACIINGPDNPILEPIQVSFDFVFNSQLHDHLHALSNPGNVTPWNVGAVTWLPVTQIGQATNSLGNLIDLPLPTYILRRNYLIDVYVQWGATPGVTGSLPIVQMMRGFSANPSETFIGLDGDLVRVSGTASVYGQLGFLTTGFPGGVETPVP